MKNTTRALLDVAAVDDRTGDGSRAADRTRVTDLPHVPKLLDDLRAGNDLPSLAAEAVALAEAARAVARRIQIASSPGRVLDVGSGLSRWEPHVGDLVYVVTQANHNGRIERTAEPGDLYDFLATKRPGYQWGNRTPDRETGWWVRFRFEGVFRILDDYYVDGCRRLIVTQEDERATD